MAEPMGIELQMRLSADEIAALSSVYIDKGVKQDVWQIHDVEINGNLLTARFSMSSFFISPTDSEGFHLSIFSTQEVLSQLANIYMHVAAGLKVKSRESWMRKCSVTCRSAIRDWENIEIEMDFFKQKWANDTLLTRVNCKIVDSQGGLFTASLKGMLR